MGRSFLLRVRGCEGEREWDNKSCIFECLVANNYCYEYNLFSDFSNSLKFNICLRKSGRSF